MLGRIAVLCTALSLASVANAACDLFVPGTSNLQAYVDGLPPNGTLCIDPNADVWVYSSVVVPSGITIQAAIPTNDPSAFVIKAAQQLTGPVFITANGSSNITFRDIEVIGNGSTNSSNNSSAVGVFLLNTTNAVIDGVWFKNTWRMNAAAVSSHNVTIENSRFADMGYDALAQGAIYISQVDTASIHDNIVVGRNNGPSGDGGIDCYQSTSVDIFNNNISNTGESSIYTSGSACPGIAIYNNAITNSNEWGIDMVNINGATISGNVVTNSFFAGMVVWDGSNSEVSNNQFYDNNRGGYIPCQGIAKKGTQTGMIYKGNTGSPTPIECIYNGKF